MEKKVSIIVPVYNVENYVDRCIQSLVKQDYAFLEILLINDGSTDSSAAKCQKWALDDERIRVIDKENGGLSDARNAGMKEATGEYLLFVDSDDFIKENMISEMMMEVVNQQSDICVCDMEYYYDDESTKFSSGGSFVSGNVKENPELLLINNSACNKLFNRRLFKEIEFPVGRVYEDLATIPKLLFEANKIVKVDKAFYVYYQREGSIVHTANLKIFDVYDAIAGCIKHFEEREAQASIIEIANHLYIIHGLDCTVVRIKDFSDASLIEDYLHQTMKYLRKYYPEYRSDKMLKKMPWKKKVIFKLMDQGWMKATKKIYGR
ncbi:MAG: glycosyltransferase family 2 protein [Anaerorhabdus sp.]